MLNLSLHRALVIAHKEIVDHVRDTRSLISALMYAMMGRVVVGLVSLADVSSGKKGSAVLTGMMSVFTLVAAFVGGMNVAMDTIAGERERRSLLPLILNPVLPLEILIGKWLAVFFFASIGLALNLAGFAGVFARTGSLSAGYSPREAIVLALAMLPLPLLAASIQLLISTVCRSAKEAQTYLSFIVFLPMGLGMFLVLSPWAAHSWIRLLPLAGQQLQLERLMTVGDVPLLQPIVPGALTVALAMLALLFAARQLKRDEIVYGS